VGGHLRHCREARLHGRDAAEVGPGDSGKRPGPTTHERQRIKDLEREVRVLRRANEILRKASAYFAAAALDRRSPGAGCRVPAAGQVDGLVHRRAPPRLSPRRRTTHISASVGTRRAGRRAPSGMRRCGELSEARGSRAGGCTGPARSGASCCARLERRSASPAAWPAARSSGSCGRQARPGSCEAVVSGRRCPQTSRTAPWTG